MQIRKYHEARDRFNAGDEVWACAYEYSHSKEGRALHQKPTLGVFTLGNNERRCMQAESRGFTRINYFVPYKKNSKELAWSKAVGVSSRCYATTEAECIGLYNELINECIDWHKRCIEELQSELIR